MGNWAWTAFGKLRLIFESKMKKSLKGKVLKLVKTLSMLTL